MAANDLTAIGALRLMHRQGVGVPDDISVVGFDDIPLSDIIYPTAHDHSVSLAMNLPRYFSRHWMPFVRIRMRPESSTS
jgi:hypothetical protein